MSHLYFYFYEVSMKKSNFIIKQPGLSERSVLMYSTITTSIIEIDEKMYSDIFEKEQYEKYADEVLSIPIYNGMTEDEQSYVISKLNSFS